MDVSTVLEDQQWLAGRLEFETTARATVNVAPKRWHPALAGVRDDLEQRARKWAAWQKSQKKKGPDRHGFNWGAIGWISNGAEGYLTPRHWTSPVKVTAETYVRALKIANCMAFAVEARGFTFEAPSPRDLFLVSFEKAQVRVGVRERIAMPTRADGSRQVTATGELMITLGGVPEFRLVDRPGHPIEGKLKEIFPRLYNAVVNARDLYRSELARKARAAALEDEQQRRAAERKILEMANQLQGQQRAHLVQSARAWKEAQEIRAFAEAVLQRPSPAMIGIHGTIEQWALWAFAVADDLDPLA
jgi:hypothetical protein